ncbi:MAG: DUF2258 domain-containing protein [Desulfurococcaceae archaeon]
MPRLISGLVIAARYADKLRKTVFAQLRDYVKKDKEFANRVAYYIASLNRALFTLLVEELKVDKLDVVRIMIEYDVDEVNKAIVWKWDTLRVEVYKRIPPETYEEHLKKFIPKAPELAFGAVKYTLVKIGETFDGDVIYAVRINEKEVGSAIVYQVDENTVVMKLAAVVDPTPAVYEKAKLELMGRPLEDVLIEHLGKLVQIGKHVSYDEALKVVNNIRSKIAVAPMEKPAEVTEVAEEESPP